MAKSTCTRNLQFDAGHRVYKHGGKCKSPHGHRYSVDVTAIAEFYLDNLGMVVDFSVLKIIIGGWLDANWDHKFLYFSEDVEMRNMVEAVCDPILRESFVSVDFNPTAENMAKFLFLKFNDEIKVFDPRISLEKVRVWETPNCFAEYVA